MISLGSFTKKEAITLITLLLKKLPKSVEAKFKLCKSNEVFSISLDDKGYVVVKKESE